MLQRADPMSLATHRFMWSIAAAGLLAATLATPAAANEVTVIATPGMGNLTMCPVTFAVYRSCNLYHHIKLPPQITVGDKVRVRFGSNPKRYSFPIARIVRDGERCTIYSQTTETEDVEKIEIASCSDAPQAE
jgi:hypothetical protein